MPYKVLFLKKISIFQASMAYIMIGVVVYFTVRLHFEDLIDLSIPLTTSSTNFQLKALRNTTDYEYSRPLLAVDIDEPSLSLDPIKKQLTELINQGCKDGTLFQASLYIRNLETGEWATVNEGQSYHPGSLSKVPVLIYFLKEAERDPSILERKLTMTESFSGGFVQTYPSKSIELNKPYTIRELLTYMATYSDNGASYLLNKAADVKGFQKVFKDLGLAVPDVFDKNYSMTVKDYSIFLRVLYNATYLNAKNSDYALSLLSQSPFNEGLKKALPSDVQIAHKFGESQKGDKVDLHESGIIYCNKRPYLVTVMTEGYSQRNQALVISHISELVYHFLCG